MKTIQIPNGTITLSESIAFCPYCGKHIPFEKIEEKWMNQDEDTIRIMCKCKKFIGITQNIKCDFVAFKL